MQLDVVNCFPTEPFDGNTYTDFTSITCGGLCQCWEQGGLQMKLVPYTVLAFVVYSVGFPAFLYHVLKKNQTVILKDQLLRCLGYGPLAEVADIGPDVVAIVSQICDNLIHVDVI